MPADEETPLLPSSSPSESSRGPSLYYATRSRSGSPARRSWWHWTRRRCSAGQGPGEPVSSVFGNGHALITAPGGNDLGKIKSGRIRWARTTLASSIRRTFSKQIVAEISKTALRSVPAVLLGMLLNILDGVSCMSFHLISHSSIYFTDLIVASLDGMITFPSNDVFQNFGGIGVSMFFVTYVMILLLLVFVC